MRALKLTNTLKMKRKPKKDKESIQKIEERQAALAKEIANLNKKITDTDTEIAKKKQTTDELIAEIQKLEEAKADAEKKDKTNE